MCGILGHIALRGHQARSLNLGSIRHRGPDASAEWTSPGGGVWLGHTRLAILDLSETGNQPMCDEGNGNVIVFNGEIYNHNDLRSELLELGVSFRGHSDTETLLRAYGVWGSTFFSRLQGMFAFAIYNARSREVTFCRDRFGIKPLYIGKASDGSLVFGSEVRPLLRETGRQLSRAGLSAYLHWGACPHQQLLFENICEFPSGCWASYNPRSSSFVPTRYWPIPAEPEILGDVSARGRSGLETASEVRALLEDAVRSHLLSDVPVACFLSGGMDSSVLTALAARHLGGGQLATFSVGFVETGFDESKFAIQMAKQYGTNHHHIHLSEADKLEYVTKGISAMDLPSTDAINTFIVSSFVAQAGFKVVLSGLGADEIFGGYPIFRDFWLVRSIAGTPRIIRSALGLVGRGRHILSDIPDEKTGESLSCWWRRVWSGDKLRSFGLGVPPYHREPGPPLQDAMGELSWGETSHYMRDMLLRDSDAMSMARSLEIRVPFLDNKLVARVLDYPAKEKFEPRIPKKLLLRATEDLLPQEIWNRPKMGFSLPMRDWMLGPLRDFCGDGLGELKKQLILSGPQADSLWRSFESGDSHWPNTWAAVVLGRYLGGLS